MRLRYLVLLLALCGVRCAAAPPPVVAPQPVIYEQKLGWILALEDARTLRWDTGNVAPAPAVPAPSSAPRPAAPPVAVSQESLPILLRDSDARIRRRAAIAIGRVGHPEGVGPLLEALRDADVEVRVAVIFALGLSGDARAVAPLTALLADASPWVQGRAAEALGLLNATSAAPALGGMVANIVKSGEASAVDVDDTTVQAPRVEALRLAIFALVRLNAFDHLGGAVLDARGEPLLRWWPVSYALQRLEDPRGLTALRVLAAERGAFGVGFAVRGLGALKDTASVDLLLRLLQEEETTPGVKSACVRALAAIGDARAVPVLLRLLATHTALDRSLLLEVVTALGTLGSPAASEALMDLVGERWAPFRAAVLTALASIDAFTFTTVLSGLDDDPDWTVRAAIASAALHMEPELAAARLRQMLGDKDPRVLPAVLRALAQSKAPDLPKILEAHLSHDDVVVRMVASQLAGEQKITALESALRAAYERAKKDDTYLARAAALVAIGQVSSTAQSLLEEGLGDPDWAVRVRAATVLRDLGRTDLADRMRPAPTRMRREDYATPSLVSPEFSPHVFIETDDGTIEIELAVLDAPLTAANFAALARKGFFDGRPIHRVVANFVVQDGDPRGDGEGGPGYTIRDELSTRPYLRGTVGMALDWSDTGGSQFFITHSPQPHLDARYTVFGDVVAGMDVVDRLAVGDVIRRLRVWDGVQP